MANPSPRSSPPLCQRILPVHPRSTPPRGFFLAGNSEIRTFVYTSRHAGRHGAPSAQAGAYPLAAASLQCPRGKGGRLEMQRSSVRFAGSIPEALQKP
eukprot:2859977-Prymnesium_polylepis.1